MPLVVTPSRPPAADVRALAGRIEAADGAPPLSDRVLGRLDDERVVHLSARDGDTLVGYGQLDGTELELAAEPEAVAPLVAAAGDGELAVWSHGRASRLVGELERLGFERRRDLHQLRRPLDDAHPLPADPPLPAGVTVRSFRPGEDDATWLALNATAFADHPEQGAWAQADLDARKAEDWFDPADVLLAVDETGALRAFHWTKVHPDGLGEVYVLAVSPDAQGTGLGRAMLTRGLHHLARRGCPAVLLYVDGDNTRALRLYERDGFVAYDLDVQWRRPGEQPRRR